MPNDSAALFSPTQMGEILAAAFATAPTHLIVVKELSLRSQCCFQTLLQLPL